VANQGYGLNKLIYDNAMDVRDTVKLYLTNNGYKSITDWIKQNPNKVYKTIDTQLIDELKNFVYKIENSSKLEIQLDSDIDEFFDNNESNILVIVTIDTKETLIKIEKTSDAFKFIVDITNEDDEKFIISTKLYNKAQLNKLVTDTIESLRLYEQFYKYADELENCL